MEFIKNLPDTVSNLSSLIEYRQGRVVSMSLTRCEHYQMMLMAVSEGEEVTSEQYPGDTIYYVLDGIMPLEKENETLILKTGECLAIPANLPHAIGGQGNFKILQIMISAK